ncbi:LacI family DNA-binding transcriptional regulator [Deinococcus roseus]|uniref:Transcriptional regulator n=1 Tax=Deinococcus roseus TaxID=392414 RepID=A0ABQ2D2N7_9DEIO|nr:LacI family DNA-binding transcriptional regulator [Deinococcus roseus]GGJ43398.1 transcriptional regulator [Deinococcus roseus]
MAKLTIKDVARHAGVQPSTVSRAINNHPDINADTKARILQSIRDLGYIPDRAAKNFRTRKMRSISLLLPMTGSDFYNRLINSIDETLEDYDYDAGIFPLLSERRLSRYQDPSALPYHTDGLVFASLNPSHLYESLFTIQGLPAVVLDIITPDFDNVTVNNELGGHLAGKHLQERPAQTFVINVEERFHTPFASGVFAERLKGFRAAQQEAGLDFPDSQVFTSEFTLDSARDAARKVLDLREGNINVFTTCDFFAYGLLEEVKLAGLTLGEEVRVVGFDDEKQAQSLGLTTLRQPVEEMGRMVTRLLMDRIQDPELPIRSVQFKPELQVRRTT